MREEANKHTAPYAYTPVTSLSNNVGHANQGMPCCDNCAHASHLKPHTTQHIALKKHAMLPGPLNLHVLCSMEPSDAHLTRMCIIRQVMTSTSSSICIVARCRWVLVVVVKALSTYRAR